MCFLDQMRARAGLIAGCALLIAASACADAGSVMAPAAEREDDPQVEAFQQRLSALSPTDGQARSSDQEMAFGALIAEIEQWNATSGRSEFLVRRSDECVPLTSAALRTDDGRPPAKCGCPATPANQPFGYSCTLTDWQCDANGRACVYRCVRVLGPRIWWF